MARKIGVDLGGSWLRIGMVDTDASGGSAPQVQKYANPQKWETFVDILSRYNTPDIEGFGVAISGPIQDHALVIQGSNLPWLTGRHVRPDLQTLLGKKVVVSNDMEAATEGEMARGVLRHYSWAIFDTISTGWGGNLVLNGQRVDGEPGHANVGFDLPYRCGAGHVGCYESLYSGSALERQIQEHLHPSGANSIPDVWQRFHKEVESGADWALALLDRWAEGVGRAWANTLNRIRPMQAIVYMGMTAENFMAISRVQKRLRLTLRKICMFPEHQAEDFPILKAQEEHRSIYGSIIVYDKTP